MFDMFDLLVLLSQANVYQQWGHKNNKGKAQIW